MDRVRTRAPRPSAMVIAAIGLMAVSLVACGRGQKPIPAGAQVVHVVAGAEVRLDAPTVHPGDVYLVLDEPLDGSFMFVSRKRTPAENPGPLSDDDLERLAHGDTEGTQIEGLSVGCDAGQRAEDRGQMGYCGNVWKFSLVAGKYAILGPTWTEQQTEASVDPTAPPGGFVPPRSMAVLEVVP
jgi:hypothetical protein